MNESMQLRRLERSDKARDEYSLRRTEYMTAIYCTRGADSGRSLSLEMEVLETDIAGR